MQSKTIGILGGGQLGRMTAQAAARLGFCTHIYTPESDAWALQVATDFTVAEFEDAAALEAFARSVDVVTYEFENIPAVAVEMVVAITPVYPNAAALRITQNRIREKSLCRELNIPTAPWREVFDLASARAALSELGGAMILKTAEMGYDGKGQWKILFGRDLEKIPVLHNRHPGEGRDPDFEPKNISGLGPGLRRGDGIELIAEGIVQFDFEISVITARGQDGEVKCYPPVRNVHRDHILYQTFAPAELSSELAKRAEKYAAQLAQKLDIVGLLAVEMFVVGNEIVVNEMAPRPHNSGHWTIEGCMTSQFEQLVRAITDMPLGDVTPRGNFVMTNLIGDEILRGEDMAREMGGTFHDYGKGDYRPGRKMGHITTKI